MIPFMMKVMTADLDRVDENIDESNKIGYLTVLKYKRVSFAGLAQFFNVMIFTAGSPIFGPRLKHTYGLSSLLIGACFALPTIFYILTGPLFLPLLTKRFEKRATIMVGFFILASSTFFIGPSKIFGLPSESAALMIIGLAIIGTGAAFTIIPIIPEMLDATKDDFETQQSQLSDNYAGIFNIAGGLGQIFGPTASGVMNDSIGFNLTFDILGLLIIAFNIIYILS